jgi:hypothetical protein
VLSVQNDPQQMVITLRATGVVRVEELQTALAEYRRVTAGYRNRPHFMLADMRGLAPLAPEAATLVGEAMAHGRRSGLVVCAHLSDSGIIRLQATRLAHEVSPHDETTVEVASEEAAREVFAARRAALVDPLSRVGATPPRGADRLR